MLFIPISVVGGMIYLLDISPSIEFELVLRVITPIYMAVAGTWLIWKYRITTFLANSEVIIYIALFVGQWIIKLAQKKNSTE